MFGKRMICTLASVLLLAACGPGGDEGGAEAMEGMPGMGGMDMEMAGSQDMMGRMGTHMQMMAAMRGDSMQGMLSTHRQMAANMIAQMNREMREMNMASDEAWDATVDSLRNDLVRMPEMGAAELEGLMPGHQRRMMRLMEMHREMMAGMGM